MNKEQQLLFELPEDWEEAWEGMPDFNQGNMRPDSTINVQFKNVNDRKSFLRLLGYPPTRAKSIWYPKIE